MTFTFTMDAFPGYTLFDKTHQVLCVIQVINPDEDDDLVIGTTVMGHQDTEDYNDTGSSGNDGDGGDDGDGNDGGDTEPDDDGDGNGGDDGGNTEPDEENP